ncbi:MAG: hypothetical protein R3E91_02395 [Chlamydiales bacterium]
MNVPKPSAGLVKDVPKPSGGLKGLQKLDIHEPKPIDGDFTTKSSIEEQRKSHERAKSYLEQKLRSIGAEVIFVSNQLKHNQVQYNGTSITDLDQDIFSYELTKGVELDIRKDGKTPDRIVLYGVASQFNGAESLGRFTVPPGQAVGTYTGDNTQGPKAQLAFPDEQVEIINNAANLGFNGLCGVLDTKTKNAVCHGYLTPRTSEQAELVIKQLKDQDHSIEYLCVGNIPKGKGNIQRVYEILVAAPAFGMYNLSSKVTEEQKKEIAYLCAVRGYSAQFEQALKLAEENPDTCVILKLTAPGLGVFGNDIEMVAKGFIQQPKSMNRS